MNKKKYLESDYFIPSNEEKNVVYFIKGFHVVWIFQHSPNVPIQVLFTIDKDFKIEHVGYDQGFLLIREIIGQGYIQNQHNISGITNCISKIGMTHCITNGIFDIFWVQDWDTLSFLVCRVVLKRISV
jgi:hypothetical protein